MEVVQCIHLQVLGYLGFGLPYLGGLQWFADRTSIFEGSGQGEYLVNDIFD